MSLTATINLAEEKVFYPGESVTGTARIVVESTIILESITIELRGISVAAYERDISEAHTIVKESDDFLGLLRDKGVIKLESGAVYEHEFRFKLPELIQCSKIDENMDHGSMSSMPPSLRVDKGGYKTLIAYAVSVRTTQPEVPRWLSVVIVPIIVGQGEGSTRKQDTEWNGLISCGYATRIYKTSVATAIYNWCWQKESLQSQLGDLLMGVLFLTPVGLQPLEVFEPQIYLISNISPEKLRIKDEKSGKDISSGFGKLKMDSFKISMALEMAMKIKTTRGFIKENLPTIHPLFTLEKPAVVDLADFKPAQENTSVTEALHFAQKEESGRYIYDISPFVRELRVPNIPMKKFNCCNLEMEKNCMFELKFSFSSLAELWPPFYFKCRGEA